MTRARFVTSEEHASRRSAFLAALRELGGAAALVPAATPAVRTHDVEYRYRQDSDFHWLTGFDEPGSYALFLPDHPEHEYVLFVRPRDPAREVWDGARAGTDGAVNEFGAKAAFDASALSDLLPKFLEGRTALVSSLGRTPELDSLLVGLVRKFRMQRRLGAPGPTTLVDLSPILHERRMRKTEAELAALRKAATIAAAAHVRAMEIAAPGMFEYELEAEIERVFRAEGAFGPAYPPSGGSGPHACTLHWVENDRRIGDAELVLVDAGCEVESYASDITRTFPASGAFTAEQREIYEFVLEAQHAAFGEVRPGKTIWDVHMSAVRVLTAGLIRIGAIPLGFDEAITKEAWKPFYMHRTSHWLGLDVHDLGDYKADGDWRPLEPGMVLTVEPGLYLRDQEGLPERYGWIGVRIEDDLLVTAGEPEILTSGVPKSVPELSAIVGRARTSAR